MNSQPQNQFRVVPTLTEIVQPGELLVQPTVAVSVVDGKVLPTLKQLDALIAKRVREEFDALVRTLIADQVEALQQRLHEEFQALVQDAETRTLDDPSRHPAVK
jgi:hypothetical protein